MAGELPRIAAVGIVGTRHPTEAAEAFAFTLARDLCLQGALVASGGASGIDSAAHRGALAAGGPTLVVAPAGLERPYPEENAKLFQEVLDAGGGYLSLRAPHEPARLASFFERNAALAALCEAVVIVQAPFRSGARNTAAAARKLGRLLCVVPNAPWEPMGRGCIAELRLGATAVGGVRDVVEALRARSALLLPPDLASGSLGAPRSAARETPKIAGASDRVRPGPELSAQIPLFQPLEPCPEHAITRAIACGERSADALVDATGLAITVVQRVLLALELEGTVVRDAGQDYRLVRP